MSELLLFKLSGASLEVKKSESCLHLIGLNQKTKHGLFHSRHFKHQTGQNEDHPDKQFRIQADMISYLIRLYANFLFFFSSIG